MSELYDQDVNWCRRRMPKNLLAMMLDVGPQLVIAGGYIRSCISNEPVADIDVFCPNATTAQAFAKQIADGRKIIQTENAITVLGHKYPIQFITRWTYEKPEDVVPSFDFTIARAAFWRDKAADKWVSLCDESFYRDLAAKRLTYCQPRRNEDAGGSMLRVLKFYQKGSRIPMDSLGAVIARLVNGVDIDKIENGKEETTEDQWSKVVTGLLREVDPNVDPDHSAHLPSSKATDDES